VQFQSIALQYSMNWQIDNQAEPVRTLILIPPRRTFSGVASCGLTAKPYWYYQPRLGIMRVRQADISDLARF